MLVDIFVYPNESGEGEAVKTQLEYHLINDVSNYFADLDNSSLMLEKHFLKFFLLFMKLVLVGSGPKFQGFHLVRTSESHSYTKCLDTSNFQMF
jgi:hypothetical protein